MIVIDTHVWVWWVDDHPRLDRAVRDLMDSENEVRLSAISLPEIATAVSLGRLVLKPTAVHWLRIAQSLEQIRVDPITAEYSGVQTINAG